MKVINRAMSRIDLFVEPRAKFFHQKLVNLISKTILSTWSREMKLNFKPTGVHVVKSCIVCF